LPLAKSQSWIVASMVSRRAALPVRSHLVCGTGGHHIRTVSAQGRYAAPDFMASTWGFVRSGLRCRGGLPQGASLSQEGNGLYHIRPAPMWAGAGLCAGSVRAGAASLIALVKDADGNLIGLMIIAIASLSYRLIGSTFHLGYIALVELGEGEILLPWTSALPNDSGWHAMTLSRQQVPLVSVSSRDHDGVTVVSLQGELDFCGSSVLQAYFSDMRRQTGLRSVADLTGLAFIDCACLTVLVRLCQDIRSQGGGFALAGPHGAVHRILAVTGMLTWFDVHATVDEAVRRTGTQELSGKLRNPAWA